MPCTPQAAREQLEAALTLAEGGGGSVADWELGELRCRLACVYRAFGGELWMDRKHAHAQLLQAAQVKGPAQVPASSPGTLPRASPVLILPRKQRAADMQQCMPNSWLQICPSKG